MAHLPTLHNVLDITDTHIVPELKIFPNLIYLCGMFVWTPLPHDWCILYYHSGLIPIPPLKGLGMRLSINMVSFPFLLRGPGYETLSVNVVLIPLQLVHQLEAELEGYEQFTGYSFSVSRPTIFQVDTSTSSRAQTLPTHVRERVWYSERLFLSHGAG